MHFLLYSDLMKILSPYPLFQLPLVSAEPTEQTIQLLLPQEIPN